MTSTLPVEVQECFERFVTTEFTTIDERQQPITWPVTPYYRRGGSVIEVTTGLGYPKKADDARKNPHVALLFSDPTGSGVEAGTRVLVQGTAEVHDEDLDANRERYFREASEKLPATRKMHPPGFVRRGLSWYYTRIYIAVRPERVFVWPDGDPTTAPQVHDARLDEVRSGHAEEPVEPHEPPAGGTVKWDSRLEQLGTRLPTAVVSWVGPDGFPISVRLPIQRDPPSHRIRLGVEPAGLPLVEGRACLTAHAHGEDFTWQENFQVRGDLVRLEVGDWALVPRRLIGGFELPRDFIGRNRVIIQGHLRFYRTARRRLRDRSG